jgi:hypothetical protein
MITKKYYSDTLITLSHLVENTGGSLYFTSTNNRLNESNNIHFDVNSWLTAAKIPNGYKEFKISVYNTYNNEDIVSLNLFVNPNDFNISQSHVFSDNYTREGWVSVAWGNQQANIQASGTTPGFYLYSTGLTNYNRVRTASFINLLDLIGLFKNNGYYFMDGVETPTIFKDGTSRVINVMDTIKIEYDGSIYLGSFDSFSMEDDAASPYRLNYSFNFIVSSFGTDLQGIDGHISRDSNKNNNTIQTTVQGFNTQFDPQVGMDVEEMKRMFPTTEVDITEYDYTDSENRDETDYYSGVNYTRENAYQVPDGTFRVTRGWRDTEPHGGKCDFRTHTGTIYALIAGTVQRVNRSYVRGGSNYVITKSNFHGTDLYVRYYHLDPDSITVKNGENVVAGSPLGIEGTDGGKYPPHCDFGARIVKGMVTNYLQCKVYDITPIMDVGIKGLQLAGLEDFQHIVFKHGEKTLGDGRSYSS